MSSTFVTIVALTKLPALSRRSAFGTTTSTANVRLDRSTARLTRDDRAGEPLVRVRLDFQFHGLADLHLGRVPLRERELQLQRPVDDEAEERRGIGERDDADRLPGGDLAEGDHVLVAGGTPGSSGGFGVGATIFGIGQPLLGGFQSGLPLPDRGERRPRFEFRLADVRPGDLDFGLGLFSSSSVIDVRGPARNRVALARA